MRRLAFVVAFLFSACAVAQSLHQAPIGSAVKETFRLGQKIVYAPAGDWTLIAAHQWTGTTGGVLPGPKFAGLYVAETSDGRLVRAVQAYTNLEPSIRGWRNDPCKRRENALAHRDLRRGSAELFCFEVIELRGFLHNASDWRQNARQWLEQHQVSVPPTLVMVRFAKVDLGYSEVFYYFDPKELASESRDAQIDAATKWAARVAGQVYAGLAR